ncbi:hypothetical protein V565_002510 [Rhizoctonia solani 123E]|uniref:Uncharacterized protein n=1 Tax=Rhizoctonia solani 123E TaxID=1423351 RepID=A0A074T0S4_9AGAM|nr:hypothetical protein V565_002510 [Rhizoctonia solani 123E]
MGAHRAASRARGHRSASCMRLERLHGTPPFPLRTAGALNLPPPLSVPRVCACCVETGRRLAWAFTATQAPADTCNGAWWVWRLISRGRCQSDCSFPMWIGAAFDAFLANSLAGIFRVASNIADMRWRIIPL